MNQFLRKLTFAISLISIGLIASDHIEAQNLSLNYVYRLDLRRATKAPKFTTFPDVEYPDSARKNGVEGKGKYVLTLTKEGIAKDVSTLTSLSKKVDNAVMDALKKIRFQPGENNGAAIDVKMFFDFIVSAIYDERDKGVKKPKIIEKPNPVYPKAFLAEKLKDKVYVAVMFYADGSLKVVGVNSTMPKEFDKAAREAASKIKFMPAVHKKSKKKVSQKITVVYKFKP